VAGPNAPLTVPAAPSGSMPPALVVPTAELAAAIAAYEALLLELQVVLVVHGVGLQRCFPSDGGGFRGARADAFLDASADALRRLRYAIEVIDEVVGQLRRAAQVAEEAVRRRQAERAAFASALARFERDRERYVACAGANPFIAPALRSGAVP
jgi:hypothetical protein